MIQSTTNGTGVENEYQISTVVKCACMFVYILMLAIIGVGMSMWKGAWEETAVYFFVILGEAVFPQAVSKYMKRMVTPDGSSDLAGFPQINLLELSGHIALSLMSALLLVVWGVILVGEGMHEGGKGALSIGYVIIVILVPFFLIIWGGLDPGFCGYEQHRRRRYFKWVWPRMIECPMSYARMVLTCLTILLPFAKVAGVQSASHSHGQTQPAGVQAPASK